MKRRHLLDRLPEPYRTQALDNGARAGTLDEAASGLIESPLECIWEAFTWSDTPEGWQYWRDVVAGVKPALETEGA